MIFFEALNLPKFQPQHMTILAESSVNQSYSTTPQWLIFLESVQNDKIQYKDKWVDDANYEIIYDVSPDRPPPLVPVGIILEDCCLHGRQLRSIATRVFIQGPVKAYKLSYVNDPRVLDELINLLTVEDRAWAAHIIIHKMLGVELLDKSPEQWWLEEGQTGKEKEYWTQYLKEVRPSLVWNPIWGYYKHRSPKGYDVD
ncbi:MAG: hypothetical protein WA902_08720 [Thermosynechococcaceae cyanobacterium]